MNVKSQDWQDLIDGRVSCLGAAGQRPLIFPGSFNPMHEGHRQMAAIASELTNKPVQPEISIANVDKPDVPYPSLIKRIEQVQRLGQPLITTAARFVEKARLFPGAIFVAGADTMLRLDHPRYYQDRRTLRDQANHEMASQRVTFLVFGRKVGHQFLDACELDLSPSLRQICQLIPERQFRLDLSSSQIRSESQRQS